MPERMPAYDLNTTALWAAELPKSGAKGGVIAGVLIPLLLIIIAIVILVLFILLKSGRIVVNDGKLELARPLILAGNYDDENEEEPEDNPERQTRSSRRSSRTSDRSAPRSLLDSIYASRTSRAAPAKATLLSAATAATTISISNTNGYTSVFADLYPEDYARPSMKEALMAADVPERKADAVCRECEECGSRVFAEVLVPEGFTKEDAAALAMYTYDFGVKESEGAPCVLNNRRLVGKCYADPQKTRGMLYLVMAALRKLPRVTGVTLYRGVRGGVDIDAGHFERGNVVVWPTLSTVSVDMEATRELLAKGSRNGKATGTLFVIEGGWGYNVGPYSLHNSNNYGEGEIVIELERRFVVTSVIKGDVNVVNLQMLDTPLVLAHVFGDEW